MESKEKSENNMIMTNVNTSILCNDVLVELSNIKTSSCDLVISSPPYNIGKQYEKKTSLDDYLEWQSRVVSELVRILSEKGSLCWQVGNYIDKGEVTPLDILFYPIFKAMGLKLRNRII